MVGGDVEQDDRDHVVQLLQVSNVAVEEKYLGLPTPQGRMTKEKFKSTKQRLANRFASWVDQSMSLAAKEVLIKSVAQAIPTYVMGIFKLLTTLCEEMEQMIRHLLWGRKKSKERCIGQLGRRCCSQSAMGGWVSEIYVSSIRLCCQDRHGD
jgi:hypothetical protein